MLEKDVATFGQYYNTTSRAYDIFAIAGQSNAYLGGLPDRASDQLDPAIDVSGGRVFQVAQSASLSDYGTIIAGDEPLKYPIPQAGAIGFGVALARDYYIPNHAAPRPDVLLVPYAVAATGFSDNRWNPGNDLFMGLCSAVGQALRLAPNATFRGLLWMQGEKDVQAGWTQSQYETAFDAMANAFRAEFGEVPIIVGSMRPGWVATQGAAGAAVAAALANTPNRLRLTAYADANTSPIIGNSDAGVHYGASEQRAFAQRWWTAWQSL